MDNQPCSIDQLNDMNCLTSQLLNIDDNDIHHLNYSCFEDNSRKEIGTINDRESFNHSPSQDKGIFKLYNDNHNSISIIELLENSEINDQDDSDFEESKDAQYAQDSEAIPKISTLNVKFTEESLPKKEFKPKTTKKKYRRKTKNFKYLELRKSMRKMKQYYRDEFGKELKQNKYHRGIKNIDYDVVNKILISFAKKIYEKADNFEKQFTFDQFANSLKLVVLANRYNKNEEFAQKEEYNIIRDVTTKFNYEAFERFFSLEDNLFMFNHFYDEYGKENSRDFKLLHKCKMEIDNLIERKKEEKNSEA